MAPRAAGGVLCPSVLEPQQAAVSSLTCNGSTA